MICIDCQDIRACYENADLEIQAEDQLYWETNVQMIFCPDCEKIAFSEEDALDRLKDVISDLSRGQRLEEVSLKFIFPDGTVMTQRQLTEDQEGFWISEG